MAIISALSADRQASKLRKLIIVVYAIYDKIIHEIYVGMTNNLDRRLKEHMRGQSKYTRKFTGIILFHKEEFENYKQARKREKYLKSGCGKEFLKEKIKQAGIV